MQIMPIAFINHLYHTYSNLLTADDVLFIINNESDGGIRQHAEHSRNRLLLLFYDKNV